MWDLAELCIAIMIWLGGALGALMAGVGHEPSRIRAYQRALRFDNRVRAMITHLDQSALHCTGELRGLVKKDEVNRIS